MPSQSNTIPTGRVRRTAKIGGLVGSQAARTVATRAANVVRSDEASQRALDRRRAAMAESIVDVLGTMKGAAMKLGQVLSFLDIDSLPVEQREVLQERLCTLTNSSSRVSFEDMRAVIETDLERPLEKAFAEFDEAPVAAASIGQVYRARLHDGSRVAVKVQYPGIAEAVGSDLQNVTLLLRAARLMAPGMDARTIAGEIRERILAECDYELEARVQRAFARDWKGHPFAVVPDVLMSLSTRRVLVSEWVDGSSFEVVKALPQEERDRFGEVLYRFFVGALYRTGRFSADPHPGNYLMKDDGTVAFIDFGMHKELPPERVELERRWIRSAMERDAGALYEQLAALGYFDPDDPKVKPDELVAQQWALCGWWFEDRELRVTRELVARMMVDASDPKSEYKDLMKRETAPPDTLFAQRALGLTFAMLGQIEASANWHRIAREYVYGDPPSTPLGEADAEFWSSRRPVPAA
jgi:predicted unusual protein kinase regulating ubiquinone biosynthesis (AarF/ABC1/UbiB family)